MSKWQPIETAPHNWEPVLIAGTYRNGVPYVKESFRTMDGHYNRRRFDPPTHWMPMPSHPATMETKAKHCEHWPGQKRCEWCDLGKETKTVVDQLAAKIAPQHCTASHHYFAIGCHGCYCGESTRTNDDTEYYQPISR